jgi:hypothetical protein
LCFSLENRLRRPPRRKTAQGVREAQEVPGRDLRLSIHGSGGGTDGGRRRKQLLRRHSDHGLSLLASRGPPVIIP